MISGRRAMRFIVMFAVCFMIVYPCFTASEVKQSVAKKGSTEGAGKRDIVITPVAAEDSTAAQSGIPEHPGSSEERKTMVVPVSKGVDALGSVGQSSDEELHITLLKDTADAQWLCELFMLKLVNEGVQQAFTALQPYMPLPKEEISMLTMQTYQQLALVEPRYGKALGYAFVKEEKAGDAIMRFVYLQKYEKHAVRWMFYFYKPYDAWMFNEFYFDDKLRELFE